MLLPEAGSRRWRLHPAAAVGLDEGLLGGGFGKNSKYKGRGECILSYPAFSLSLGPSHVRTCKEAASKYGISFAEDLSCLHTPGAWGGESGVGVGRTVQQSELWAVMSMPLSSHTDTRNSTAVRTGLTGLSCCQGLSREKTDRPAEGSH